MSKLLPYFRWYPADAETDEHFRLMDDADIGFYVRCLNHAWINGGIPADASERAKALRTRKDSADKRWIRVAPCFKPATELGVTLPNADTILCNPRQECERKLASRKSQLAIESVNHRYERSTNVDIRARVRSVSDSSLLLSSGGAGGADLSAPRGVRVIDGAAFTRWLKPWPRVGKPDEAARAWLSAVQSPEDETAAFAARDRYLNSDEVARDVIKEPCNFLLEQARGHWAGKWPPSKQAQKARALGGRINEAPKPLTADELKAMMADEDPRIREIAQAELTNGNGFVPRWGSVELAAESKAL